MTSVVMTSLVMVMTLIVVEKPADAELKRGFKMAALNTARGFGKRAELELNGEQEMDLERGYGNGFGSLINNKSPAHDGPVLESEGPVFGSDGPAFGSEGLAAPVPAPAGMTAQQLASTIADNPVLALYFVRSFVDQNGDDYITKREFLAQTNV